MTGAILLGLILTVGGAVLEWLPLGRGEGDDDRGPREALLFRAYAAKREVTRTSRLLQALGTVLVIIGVLALMI